MGYAVGILSGNSWFNPKFQKVLLYFFSLKVLQFYIEVHSPFWILCELDEE